MSNLKKIKRQVPEIKIKYFGLTGRAYSICVAAFIRGITFEYECVSQNEFNELIDDNKLIWDNLPELIVYTNAKELQYIPIKSELKNDDIKIESENDMNRICISKPNAILRYVGCFDSINNGYYLYPKYDMLLCAQIDDVLEIMENIQNILLPIIKQKNIKSKKSMFNELIKDKNGLIKYFNYFENIFKNNGYQYLFGNRITIADIKVYEGLRLFGTKWLKGISMNILKPFNNINKFKQNMGKNNDIINFEKLFQWNLIQFKSGKSRNIFIMYGIFNTDSNYKYYSIINNIDKILYFIDTFHIN